jgi:hypothetical protein
MRLNSMLSRGVWVLKWLGTPRAAWTVMRVISMPSATAARVAAARARRAPLWSRVTIQATVSA